MSQLNNDQFQIYLNELLNWNKKVNLTTITDPEEIRLKHFTDSLALLETLPLTNQTVVDIGSGAGFPGIPLKIACPEIKLTLIEARQKKVEFLKHLVKILQLKEVEIIWDRAEQVAKTKRECFDLAVARAIAKLNVLSEYCLPLVKINGLFVAYKEQEIEEEAKQAESAFGLLGGKLKEIKKYKLGNSDIFRSLVIVKKISPTPKKFPRRPGMAKKKPL